jgi:hypothetical protein
MNVAALNETASHLKIAGITLHAHSADVHESFIPHSITEANFLNLQWGATQGRMLDMTPVEPSSDVMHFRAWHVLYGTVARLVLGTPTAEVNPEAIAATIRAQFLVQYVIDQDWNPEDLLERLGEFTKNSVTHQVWPYWREYLQNTGLRMGLPPMVIGFRHPPAGSTPAVPAEPPGEETKG